MILWYNNRKFEHYVTAVMLVGLNLISFFVSCDLVHFQHRLQILVFWISRDAVSKPRIRKYIHGINDYYNFKLYHAYHTTIMGIKYTTIFGWKLINWLNRNYKRRTQLSTHLSAKWKFIEGERSAWQLRRILFKQGKFYFRNSHPLITLWNFMLAAFNI